MRRVLLAAAVLAGLSACQKEKPRDTWSFESVLACQNAVLAKGFPGGTFEDVDVEPVPAGQVGVRGFVVLNGQRTPFTCSFDANGGVAQVIVNGQPR